MATPKRIAWDACTWISLILQEESLVKGGGIEDRGRLCNHVISLAIKGQLEIATSGLSLAEVCKSGGVKSTDPDVLSDFFRRPFIIIVPVDRYVGTMARSILQSGHPGLKPPDAVHLASALAANVAEFHTFDDKLLNLSGKLRKPDGGVLVIAKPTSPPGSLFER